MLTDHLSIPQATYQLKQSGNLFTEVFKHGTLSVEFYKPEKTDNQTPHDRDEVYIIATGTGQFYNDGITTHFNPGDFLFVPAGVEHRFLNFTDDFSTWVLFYGPLGGER
jgi:mannose-6-phosphate isomerase-like protein (cupin superfamily)